MDFQFFPVSSETPVSQTYQEHIATKARDHLEFYNPGIDYACEAGSPVYSVLPGQVLEAGWNKPRGTAEPPEKYGYGLYVKIQHEEGLITLYAHLSTLFVTSGDQVQGGKIIALSGSTGNSTGPHLHFEVREHGTPVDPARFFHGAKESEPDEDTAYTMYLIGAIPIEQVPSIQTAEPTQDQPPAKPAKFRTPGGGRKGKSNPIVKRTKKK